MAGGSLLVLLDDIPERRKARAFQRHADLVLEPGNALVVHGGDRRQVHGLDGLPGGALNGPGNLVTAGGAMVDFAGGGTRVLNNLSLNAGSLNLGAGSLDVQSGLLLAAGGTVVYMRVTRPRSWQRSSHKGLQRSTSP